MSQAPNLTQPKPFDPLPAEPKPEAHHIAPDRIGLPSTRGTTLVYRPDIDGMRAIAVLLVILDHIHTRFSGGYIGVDVFFVISGYLISSAIISEMSAGKFSIVHFYERRIRRIFPALLVTIIGTAALAYRYLVPSETIDFAKSALAAEFSVSNFYFLFGTDYFAPPSGLKPLLHTWSLSVEEQFYIFFPILLVLVQRFLPRRLKTCVWIGFTLSFALACFWVWREAPMAYFVSPLRAWELLAGTIISQQYLPAIRGKIMRNVAALAGLLLILIPTLIYSAETPFPGVAALPPCVGAALLIASGETGPSIVGSILSWRPIVFVGLISYSLYLWHWPILVFQRTNRMLVDAAPETERAKWTVVLVSLIVATLSWAIVERPFRKGKFRPGQRTLLQLAGAAFAVVALLAVAMIATHGISSRFSGEALAVSRYATFDPASAYRENVCFLELESAFKYYQPNTCLRDDPTRRHFLLLGDSHGAQMYPGLAAVFPEINLSEATVAHCRPYVVPQLHSKENCRRMAAFLYGDYLLSHKIDTVLLGGRWDDEHLSDLANTVAWLRQHGMRVIIFGPNIEYDLALPRVLAFSLRDHNPAELLQHQLIAPEELDLRMAALAREWGAGYISIYQDLCHPQPTSTNGLSLACPSTAQPGVPLLFNTDHLTPEGSTLWAKVMREKNQLP